MRNCLFVWLPAFLLVDIVCVFACLPYFFQSFCALLNCVLQSNDSCLCVFDVCRLLVVSLPRFGQFVVTLNSLCLCYMLS